MRKPFTWDTFFDFESIGENVRKNWKKLEKIGKNWKKLEKIRKFDKMRKK